MSLESVGSFVIFLLVLSGLVFVHELGHFITAKRFNIHIEEFGIGFPPRVLGVVRDADGNLRWFLGRNAPKPEELGGPRTIYSLNAIPLGGFVRPVGEDDPTVRGGLAAASKTARIAVLSAGSIFNFVFGFLVLVAGFRLGWPDRVIIKEVVPDTPAQRAGLQAGDVVLRAEDTDIHYPQQLSRITRSHLGQPLDLLIERSGQQVEITVTPRTQWPEGQGPMGIQMGQSEASIVYYSWPQAVVRAGQEIAFQVGELIHLPGRILRNEESLETARPCGPVCLNDLTRVAVDTAQETRQTFPIFNLVAVVSIALGMTNLLPLPALDGGRILFVLIEAVRGRRVDPAREGMVHLVGMAMLLALMAVITYQDIFNPIIPR
jgi:regulator of sigma E protease